MLRQFCSIIKHLNAFFLIFFTFLTSATLTNSTYAQPLWMGMTASIPLIDKDPPNLHGYRGSFWFQPHYLVWPHARIYFDAGYSHLWVTQTPIYQTISIYYISPLVRFDFRRGELISPFIRLGIGLAALSKTHFADQKLGIHFAFQDEVGAGLSFGRQQNVSVMLSALHYSNGSMSAYNAGITIPLVLTLEYRFV